MRGVGLKAVADAIRENHLLHFHEMKTRPVGTTSGW
ncbi:unnamed protein product [Ascophyllum nodosum]